jgi:hypothetical protein
MAVAAPKLPSSPTAQGSPAPAKRKTENDSAEWWVEPIKWVALAIFIGIPIFAYFVQPLSGRVVWTVAVASLPLFIVLVGYHRWRRICPLAFFAQLPVRLRRPGKRRAAPWLEANYYYIAFSVFFFSLWIRLIATNGDGRAIALFFILLSLTAFIFGLIYTGKTWCNYICPVSFIEKIYTEPHGLRETENSQCAKCTACKKMCPDINEENGYWKEIELSPKRFVYFAFPGLVFGFYFYYYLQSGTWDYYFGGSWTNQPRITSTAFLPGTDAETAGFYFLPWMPRAWAAILTLATTALTSFFLFSFAERYVKDWLKRRNPETDDARARHVMLTLAAFTAFTTFYTFAGAPTLRKVPWLPHFFLVLVVLTATSFLLRRLIRTQKSFTEETLARNLIKRWSWADTPPPKDLREAFLIHTIRSRESDKGYEIVLATYKEAVRETLADGFATREEVNLLESLRNQLQIKKVDHDKIMAALAEEERAMLVDPAQQISAEKRLQLEAYTRALADYLNRAFAEGAPENALDRLRDEYRITPEEHAAVMDKVLGGEKGLAARLAEELREALRAAQTSRTLAAESSPVHDFLRHLLLRQRERAVSRMLRGLGFAPGDEASSAAHAELISDDATERASGLERLRATVSADVYERLFAAYSADNEESTHSDSIEALHRCLSSTDPYVRAVALYNLGEKGWATEETLARLSGDEHELVRETATTLIRENAGHSTGEKKGANLSTVGKMIVMRSVPIFATLEPEELATLARASTEDFYQPGEILCVEGETGNEVFILLAGEVEISRREGEAERIIGTERAGGMIGEMAVLDPAPRSATVTAGRMGARVLRLNGDAFRNALNDDPAIAIKVTQILARRLRNA